MTTENVTKQSGGAEIALHPFVSPYYDHGGITIYHGDCREIAPMLGRFDLLLTDPPYGLGERLKGGTSGEWSKGFEVAPEWDKETPPDWLIAQLVAQAGSAIVWGGNYYGLPPARGWVGWDKMQDHSSGHYELGWSNLEMPTRMYRKSRVEAYGQMDKRHPTQKPAPLMQWCIELAGEVQTIFDPFAGSGTTGRAAKDLGKSAVLIEREEKYCEIAVQRLSQEVLPLG